MAEHPLASVTVTEYVPLESAVMVSLVLALLQRKEYGAVPPATATLALPSGLHEEGVEEVVSAKAAGSLTVAEVEAVHPLVSVTVTEYAPAGIALRSSDAGPLFQRKV